MRFPLQIQCARVTQLALKVQGNVVEQLPQHAVAEAIVMQINLKPQQAARAVELQTAGRDFHIIAFLFVTSADSYLS